MNPYEPSVIFATPQNKSDQIAHRKRNPAKRYLVACAVLCFLGMIASVQGPIAMLQQVPARHLFSQTMAFTAFSLFAVTSAYLAFGDFGKVNRVFSVAWALIAAIGMILVITYVDPFDPTDARNFPGMIALAGCFALLGYIAWLCMFIEPKVLTTDLEST